MKATTQIIISEINNVIRQKTVNDIIDLKTDNIFNKSAVPLIVKKYINNNSMFSLDVLKDHNIVVKFIPIDIHYKCHEAMSFSNTSLYNILFEDWDSQDLLERALLRNRLSYNYLFIPIIKIKQKGVYNNYNDWKIGDLSFWAPSEKELEQIGKEWNDVKRIVKEGVRVDKVKFGKSFRTTNNLPKQSETDFIHLRPHAKNSRDYDIPYLHYTNGKIEITKQSFWLNKKFINQLLEEHKWEMNLKGE